MVLCAVSGDLTWAQTQTTNGIPIVHRKHRYSGRVQLLGGTAADLPPPPPSEEDRQIKEQNDANLNEDLKAKSTTLKAPLLPRRDFRREREQEKGKERENDPFKSLFITDSSVTNKVDPEIKKWGWLAEETDLTRQRLETMRKPTQEQESWTNSLAGNAKTNETQRMEAGSLQANTFVPMGGERETTGIATTNKARVVVDHIADKSEQRRQNEAKEKTAQKESVNLAEKSDMPVLFTSTNETLGLNRLHKDEPQSDMTLANDFSQTRKVMADITSRYQLGLNMTELIRRPASPTADSGKPDVARVAYDKDGAGNRFSESRRPSVFGEVTPGTTTQPSAQSPSVGGPAWVRSSSSSGIGVPNVSANAAVEGPKMPKATDLQVGSRFVSPTPPASVPMTVPVTPTYTPGSITPSFTSGNRPSGSLTPSFKPTTPYKNPFDNSPSR